MAPVDVTSFDRRRPQAPAPLACATVENHIPALVREYMLEVQILFGSVRDTMKTRSATIASAGFQTLTHFHLRCTQRRTPSDAKHSAPRSGKLSSQKTPRPARRKADSTNSERAAGTP